MRISSKCLALILTVMIITSSMVLLIAKPATAQSVPTPIVPEITLHFVDAPYIVTSTNYSTGQTETHQVSSRYVEVIVKNQPFDYANSSYHVYYNVRYKPNFDTSGWWMQVGIMNASSSPPDNNGAQSYASYLPGMTVQQSSGEQTILTFALLDVSGGYDVGYYENGQEGCGQFFPSDGKVDFQVQALVGHDSQMWVVFVYTSYRPSDFKEAGFVSATAYDSSSSWSDTQTLDLAYYPKLSSTTSATTSTSLLGWSWLVIAVVLVAVLLVVAAVKARRVNSY